MVKYFILILILATGIRVHAQDSVIQPPPDTSAVIPPVIKPLPKKPIRKKEVPVITDTFQRVHLKTGIGDVSWDTMLVAQHPYFQFTKPVRYSITMRVWQGKEAIFYAMIALLLFFALIRNGFRRYIQDLFKIFFRTTVNQRQVKEQLLQSPLPSMLLNVFFLLSIGMFIALVLQYFKFALDFNFWILFCYSVVGLILIYSVKFIVLKIMGWIFQVSEAVDAYIFVIFTTNKIIGMALLPFLVVLAFAYGFINQAAMNLSILMVVVLFAYRFYLSYVSVHRLVRIHFFHFLIYLFAFEIVPLLLINKLLFRLLGETS